jgi:hypothetical protein
LLYPSWDDGSRRVKHVEEKRFLVENTVPGVLYHYKDLTIDNGKIPPRAAHSTQRLLQPGKNIRASQ